MRVLVDMEIGDLYVTKEWRGYGYIDRYLQCRNKNKQN